jgi:NHL repeat
VDASIRRRRFAIAAAAASVVAAAAAGAASASGGGPVAPAATLELVAGNGVAGYLGDGGPATLAQLYEPAMPLAEPRGGILLVDASNRVRRIAPDGTITTVAGSGIPGYTGDGGPAVAAQLNTPTGIAHDAAGNLLIADSHNHVIRRVAREGTISTVAGNGISGFGGDGGPAIHAELTLPEAVAVDPAGNVLIADSGDNAIRKVDASGTITRIAGGGLAGFGGDGGPATLARLNHPTGIAVARTGDVLIADQANNRLRRIAPDGTISTVAGTGVAASTGDGGPARKAGLSLPVSVLVDRLKNVLVTESGSADGRVRRIAADGTISTVAGGGSGTATDGALATSVSLDGPAGMALDGDGELLVASYVGNRLWRLVPPSITPPPPGP